MNIYTFNNIKYYLADDVYIEEPISFIGCSKNSRFIVKKKHLNDTEYIFMKYIKSSSEWVISEEKYKLAKLFITKEWVHNNLLKFKENKTDEDLKLEAMIAPDILELEDEDKFKDINGNILDIEVRGTRDINNIYFKVKDVSTKFNLGDITNTLLKSTSSFERNKHFVLFKNIKYDNVQFDTNKNNKFLFLTFSGLTKLLFVSQSSNAEHFQSWAINILFIHKMGTPKQRNELCNSLIGITPKTVKQVLSCNTNKVPCIYLLYVGDANQILEDDDINNNNNNIVCKYGCTDDLPRRLLEHDRDFKKYNKNISLLYFSIIDPTYIFKAENDINFYISEHIIQFYNKKELFVINKSILFKIKRIYSDIQDRYIGRYAEMVVIWEKRISMLERDLEKSKYENSLLMKDIELMKKDNELLELKLSIATK
jgi:hypothetical protein